MNLQERKDLLVKLGNFMQSDDEAWQAAKQRATRENAWFLPEFITLVRHYYRSAVFDGGTIAVTDRPVSAGRESFS